MTTTLPVPGTAVLAAGARRLSDLAAEVRGHAAGLVLLAAGAQWRSTAAEACRARLVEVGRDLLGAAALLEHAATTLDDHARTAGHRAVVLEQAAADLVRAGVRAALGRGLS